jgi:hypothetical protein
MKGLGGHNTHPRDAGRPPYFDLKHQHQQGRLQNSTSPFFFYM